jgi:hypothetical protein
MSTDQYRSAWDAYQGSLNELYEQPIRTLIAAPQATEVASPSDDQLGEALEHSDQLRAATVERLGGDDRDDAQLAMMQLAAGASVDLGVAMDLARRSNELDTPGVARSDESLSAIIPEAAEVLGADRFEQVLGVAPQASAKGGEAGESASGAALATSIEATIARIRKNGAVCGETAIKGIGTAAIPWDGLAGALAKGLSSIVPEDISGLARRAVQFALRGIEKLLGLLGTKFGEKATAKVSEWLGSLKEADALETALKFAWGTQQIESDTKKQAVDAGATMTEAQQKDAEERLETLGDAFEKQSKLLQKVLKGVNFFAGPIGSTPPGKLFLALGNTAAIVYVVVSGGDYVDWDRVGEDGILDRVEGVRHIVTAATGAPSS